MPNTFSAVCSGSGSDTLAPCGLIDMGCWHSGSGSFTGSGAPSWALSTGYSGNFAGLPAGFTVLDAVLEFYLYGSYVNIDFSVTDAGFGGYDQTTGFYTIPGTALTGKRVSTSAAGIEGGLLSDSLAWNASIRVADGPPWGSLAPRSTYIRVQGTFAIVFTAWVIPDPATSPDGTGEAGTGAPAAVSGPYSNDVRNACSVATPSHVVISSTSPGAGYVMLGTPPTPVVDSVTPPAGTTNGGQAVTIRGAAFSDDATVTFAGVAATSVVVVSQFEITCVTPAHAAGSADVVVTNGDGSHS